MSADRNLLFGILAVQSGFCTGPQLVEAMNAWTLAKERPLGALLVERGFLQSDEHDLIAALVDKQLAKHGGDADKSLAALTPLPRLAAELRRIGDADVQQSLAALPDGDAERTRTFGTAPSGGPVRYRILRPHARGGLGEVFVARDEELGREVALKEIQPEHADRPESRGRFVREAEVTGGLEHPGIVAVYGLGSYADGRPFYAMRFIQGDSLKEAIDRFHAAGKPDFSGSEFRQLLGRFIDVCQAIAYAHSRGVLHRDLKPGNIMLGKFGETLVVDWGLAKVVGTKDAESGDRTLNISSGSGSTPTMQGQAIGTPAFMSPEQAAGRLDELGPATDVYSLGATLYVLLANRAPIESGRVEEMLRKAERGEWTPLRAVNPSIPAPLAAICAKAMALKPNDRYASAQVLADDVERYLADEPVSAHRDPPLVRISRWARKNRTAVVSAVAVLLVGAAAMGIGLAVVGDRNAKLASANSKLDDARRDAEGAKDQALKRLDQVEKSNEILGTVFQDLDIRKIKQGNEPLEAVLAKRLVNAGEQLKGEAVGDPLIEAKLQNILGHSLLSLGFAVEATALFEEATITTKSKLGLDHLDTLGAMHSLAVGFRDAGKLDRALPIFEETLEALKAKVGFAHPATLATMNSYAVGLLFAGKFDQALLLFEETVSELKAKKGSGHPDTLKAMNNLAWGLQSAGKIDQALPLVQENLKLTRAVFGPNHPETLRCMNILALGLEAAGKIDQALSIYEETHKLTRAKLGSDHPDTITTMNNLAMGLESAGKIDQALALYEESLKLTRSKLGPEHPDTITNMNNLASGLRAAGKIDQALALFEQASTQLAKRRFQHEHAERIVPNTAKVYESAKQWAKAESWRRQWSAFVKESVGAQSSAYAGELAQLGDNLLQQLKHAEAEGTLRECLFIREKIAPDAWSTFNTLSSFGAALLGQKKYADAEAPLLKGYEGLKRREHTIPALVNNQRLGDAAQRLVDLYTATNKPDEVKKWQAERAKYAAPKKSAEPPKQPEQPAEKKKTEPAGRKEAVRPGK
jgi:serine/threonine protein kinase